MKGVYIKSFLKNKYFKSKYIINVVILVFSVILLYLLISIYFASHFFFNTEINGIEVSLKAHAAATNIIRNHIKDYRLQLIERDGEVEEIIGQDIEMQYNEKNSLPEIYHKKSSFNWISSLFRHQEYYIDDLVIYNKDKLEDKIKNLNCLNKSAIKPENVSFKYLNGSYEIIKEIYGNIINKDRLNEAIKVSILQGKVKLDLNEEGCYENPKYTVESSKTSEAKNLLNKYVSTRITYIFGNQNEILDGDRINKWLSVDENLDVKVSEIGAMKYVKELSRKYDTVGITRSFKASTGKVVEVSGGLYGWKINFDEEVKTVLNYIKLGKQIEREPIYAQKSLSRVGNEIGNTYVEINITKQHLWFYKKGKVITQGSVVTGNPNRGNATVLGAYMLNYKQKGANLTGPGYEAAVTYWMPFFGNIGIHDASWRYSFGGEIYKRNGSHGCVNTPLYLAKTIFENIEEGTPIICYEE